MNVAGVAESRRAKSAAKVLLVGWAGADFGIAREQLAAGHMPCLARIAGAGAFGLIDGCAPASSPMAWTTIATGKDPEQHGIHGFASIDEGSGRATPISGAARRTKALWNLLSEQGNHCGIVGWLGSHPAEAIHGVFVSDAFARGTSAPPLPGSVFPADREADLSDLRLAGGDVDPGLLGLFIPRLKEIDLGCDSRPARLLERLAELYTLHNVAVTLASEGQPDFLTVQLPFLDWVGEVFSPFHPPHRAGINARDFEFYQHVVAGAYRLADLLLADLLRHCAMDTNVVVVSDRGLSAGSRRPQGLFAAAGPGVRPRSRMNEARLADVSPTVLALFGLPKGADMRGRALSEILTASGMPADRPSWDTIPPAAPPPVAGATACDEALLRQFVERGYLPAALLDADASSDASEDLKHRNQWSLGVALMEGQQPERALPHLHACFLAEPESARYAFHLARCQFALGLAAEAERSAAMLADFGEDDLRTGYFRAELALLAGRFSAALAHAGRARRAPALARDCDRISRTALIHLRRFTEARTSLEAALLIEPEHALLHAGLATVKFHQRDWPGANEAARRALALAPGLALAERILDSIARRHGAATAVPTAVSWSELTARALRRERLREESAAREQHWREQRLRTRQVVVSTADTDAAVYHLIVSGVPRSGTSLMLRMLAMSGLPVLTDGVRPPDEHNPFGYFEWEPAKKLPHEPGVITEAAGHAIKVVSSLLPHLPPGRRYRVLFMRRSANEIFRSQQLMSVSMHPAEIAGHIEHTLAWARNAAHIELLEVPFADLVRGDAALLERITCFVGPARLKRPAAMLRAIEPELYHQRLEELPHV